MKFIRINLQQTLVLSEGNTILAAASEHDNKVVFNKPMLLDDDKRTILVELENSGIIDLNEKVEMIYTDSFSVGYWDADLEETSLL